MRRSAGPAIVRGLRDGVPIAASFSFLFLAVGGASRAAGLDWTESVALTVAVFAAPAQFAIVDLVADHAWLAVLITTTIVNFRFVVMSAALLPHFKGEGRMSLLTSIQFLTASTFAVAFPRLRSGRESAPLAYFLGVCFVSFPFAVIATGVGHAVADRLSGPVADTLRMILPIYFTTLVARVWPERRLLAAALGGFVLTPLLARLFGPFGLVAAALTVATLILASERLRDGRREG